MLDGYITYNELKLLTGWTDSVLKKFIHFGLKRNELDLNSMENIINNTTIGFKQQLFNLNDVEQWLKVHVF